MERFEDKNYDGNSSKHHTGKPCCIEGCVNPAGTSWSPVFCFECNVKRIKRIDAQFDDEQRQRWARVYEKSE